MFQYAQTSFSRGEVSPAFYHRSDLEIYNLACRRFRDCILTSRSTALRRPGTRYVAAAATDENDVRLVPFVFDRDDAWVLEFTDSKIRFYTAGAQVGAPYEVTTPYSASEVQDLYIAQSADTVYIAHPSHALRKLVRFAAQTWTLSTVDFDYTGPFQNENIQTISLELSNNTDNAVATLTASEALFTDPDDVDAIFQIDGGWVRVLSVQSTTKATVRVLYENPSTSEEETTNWVGPFREGSSRPANITVPSDTTAGSVVNITASPGIFTSADVGKIFDIDAGGTANTSYGLVTAYVDTDEVQIRVLSPGTLTAGGSPYTNPKAIDDTAGFDASTITITPGATIGSGISLTASDDVFEDDHAATASEPGAFIKLNNGVVEVTAVTDAQNATGTVRLALSTAVPAPNWSISSFSRYEGFPAVVAFANDRLYLGNTTRKPAGIWASQSGDYENFTAGVQDADSLNTSLATDQIDAITWIALTRQLFLGTDGAVHRLTGDPISPTNIEARLQDPTGCRNVKPVMVRDKLLFVEETGKKIYELTEGNSIQGDYSSSDLSFFATHLFGSPVKAWSYEASPYSIIWACLENGDLVSFSYLPEFGIAGWQKHTIAGTNAKVISLASIPYNNQFRTWLVVSREVDGNEQRTVEYFDYDSYTDSAKHYAGPITTLTGLSHLEGEDVVARADGDHANLSSDTVASGQVVLSSQAASTAEVGLSFTPTIEPMAPLIQTQAGMLVDTVKIHRVKIRVLDTVAVAVDGDNAQLPTANQTAGDGPGPFTGYLDMDPQGKAGDRDDPTVTITCPAPVDFEIAGVFMECDNA